MHEKEHAGRPRLPIYDGQCDPPFQPMKGSKCYFLSYGTFERSWQTAQQLCRVLHPMGSLAEFEDLEELIDATLFLSNDDHDCRSWSSPGPWIGGIEVGDSNTFTWASSNSTIQNFNWAEGRPNSASSNDGIALDCSSEFKWIDLDNTLELPFLCEIPPNPPAPTYTCPEGFNLVGKFCFATGSETLTWDQAQSYCKSLTGTGKLVEIQTEEELEELKTYLADDCLGVSWIGAEQVPGAGNVFRWASTRRLVTVGDWEPGRPEPDDEVNEDAVFVKCSEMLCDERSMSPLFVNTPVPVMDFDPPSGQSIIETLETPEKNYGVAASLRSSPEVSPTASPEASPRASRGACAGTSSDPSVDSSDSCLLNSEDDNLVSSEFLPGGPPILPKHRIPTGDMIVNSGGAATKLTLKYLEKGHTSMSADSFHHLVEQGLGKREKVSDFQDFKEIVDTASKSGITDTIMMDHTAFRKWPNDKILRGKSASIPTLRTLKVVEFRQGTTNIYWKKDFDADFSESPFLTPRFALGFQEGYLPPERTAPRGIPQRKKDVIIKTLGKMMGKNRLSFWQEMPTDNDREDLMEVNEETEF
ncbi:unnamed protein product [Cyprideis torosa]|uniref:Uncharacterized protein n=1 Tax=Cyprideis torosa TaxID=163714 RepID=A0A7R8WK81_9CRUS|nr:unnamed protein product [Cyprideis torosa]CAG0896652.1 unnamed protein product [Cyprideis torosa]